jgi:hypothetical protein
MDNRNKYLESDGLLAESETHEWFGDKTSTDYARKKSIMWGSGEHDDSLNVTCMIVRCKETGDYDRVMMDNETNEIVYDTKSLETLGSRIDMMKASVRFK